MGAKNASQHCRQRHLWRQQLQQFYMVIPLGRLSFQFQSPQSHHSLSYFHPPTAISNKGKMDARKIRRNQWVQFHHAITFSFPHDDFGKQLLPLKVMNSIQDGKRTPYRLLTLHYASFCNLPPISRQACKTSPKSVPCSCYKQLEKSFGKFGSKRVFTSIWYVGVRRREDQRRIKYRPLKTDG